MDDDVDADAGQNPSREGFCTAMVQKPSAEVRELAAIYRLRPAPSGERWA